MERKGSWQHIEELRSPTAANPSAPSKNDFTDATTSLPFNKYHHTFHLVDSRDPLSFPNPGSVTTTNVRANATPPMMFLSRLSAPNYADTQTHTHQKKNRSVIDAENRKLSRLCSHKETTSETAQETHRKKKYQTHIKEKGKHNTVEVPPRHCIATHSRSRTRFMSGVVNSETQ